MHTAALLCAALVGSLACDRSSINSPETSSPAHGFSGTSTLINPWPDEPAGYSVLTDYGFEDTVPVGRGLPVGSSGWFVADNDLGFVTRIMDSGAPFSPPNVLQHRWPVGWNNTMPMGFLYYDFAGSLRMYVGFWWKPSNPWQGHAHSNTNKIMYVFSGDGNIFMAMYGPTTGPFEVRLYPEFSTSRGIWLTPNVSNVAVTLGQWHQMELLVDYSTSPGHVQWWMDGVLLGDYSDDPAPATSLIELQLHPVWGGAETELKQEVDYYWYDHVHVSH